MDFKAEANANDNNLYGILFRQNGGDVVDQVYLNINNDYSGHLYNATGSISHNFPAGYFTEGQWYTLRGTYDNNSHVSAYLNGVLIEQWHSVDTSVAEGSFAIELWNGTIRNLTYKGDIGVTINRNDTYAVSGSFSDPDSASWSATVDYGDGSGTSPLTLSGTNFSLNHTYTTAGTYTVTVSVTDNQGLTGTQTEKIIVTNYAPPSVTMPSNSTKNVGDTYSGSGSFTDTDSSSWTATVNYGDGSGTQPLTLSGMTFSLSHTYSSVGTYTVTVTVTDNQGASGQASATVTVQRQLTTLTSAQVWLERGLLTPGLKLDVLAQVYKDSTLVSSGQLNSVNVGSGILFNGATQVTVPFNAFTPVNFPTGSALKMTVSVRNACSGSTANGGNARLWYNDGSANSHFGATIGTSTNSYYLLSGNALGTSAGNNRQNIVVASGTRCSAFKPFGTWTITP